MAEVTEIEQSTALTTSEQQRLGELEGVVARGLKTFVEVGNALMEIRDGRLYREWYGTFEAYCEDKWGMQRRRVYQLMDAAAVVENVNHGTQSVPENERQARPLAKLPPEQQPEAWRRAVESAPNGKVTGAHVQKTVDEMLLGDSDPVPFPDPVPEERVVEAGRALYEMVERSNSTALIATNKGIKRPFEYDGKLYVSNGGGWGVDIGEYRNATRVVPLANWPGRPYTLAEIRARAANGPCYYFGMRVSQGANEYVLDPRERIRFVLVEEVAQLRQMEVSEGAVEVSEDTSTNGPLDVLHSSESNEWYTPAQYIEAVRKVMYGIDLDPASCAYADQIVQAGAFYTVEEDGLAQEWKGRVFLNPPYGKDGNESSQGVWSERLIAQYRAGKVTEAILLVNAVPGNRWWAPLWDYPICFPDHRIRFYNGDGTPRQPPHSSAFVYLGKNTERFVEVFTVFGPVVTEVARDDAEDA